MAVTGLSQQAETQKLAEAVKPAIAAAVLIGAGRVASALGVDVSDDDEDDADDLAGALAYKFADQWTGTSLSSLSDLLDSDGDIGAWFDQRSDIADDAADTIASNAINGGAQDFADSSDSGVTKTWTVTDDDPCADCSGSDGETVGSDDDFSNGAPYGPIHPGCNCTVDWTSDSESRAYDPRSTMTERAALTAKERDNLSDSDFAYVDSDGEGHLPIHDAAHVRAAMGGDGWEKQQFESPADKTAAAKKIIAAAKKFDIEVDPTTDIAKAAGVKAPESKSAPSTAAERRAASMSFGDTQSAVYTALTAALPWPADCWIVDMGADWVVYQDFCAEGLFQLNYSMDSDGNVSFDGAPTPVNQVTSFVPAEDRAAKGKDANGDGMVTCPTCSGKGTILEGNRECPDCHGDGKVVEGSKVLETKSRRLRRQRRDLPRHQEMRKFTTRIELRGATIEGKEAVLVGTPIKFNTRYMVIDRIGAFRERMMPTVADEVLGREIDCRFLENHTGRPYARTSNGTLTLTRDDEGVHSEARIDLRRSDSRDLALTIERGDVNQMSCGFLVADDGDEWHFGDDGTEERDVHSFAELFDVSAVTYPASETTSIELAQRMLMGLNDESRERLRRLWHIAKDIREGKVLSQQNGQELMDALEALHEADDVDIPEIVRSLQVIDKAIDAGQAGLSSVLGRANPDGDPDDLEPALVPPSDEATRELQLSRLRIIRARELLKV